MQHTTREQFIAARVAAARSKLLGARARAMFNAEVEAEQAGAAWDAQQSPEAQALQATIAAMTARGGKLWADETKLRMYFNSIPVGAVGRKFDCYVDLRTGELCDTLTEEERIAARVAIWGQA